MQTKILQTTIVGLSKDILTYNTNVFHWDVRLVQIREVNKPLCIFLFALK